MTHTTHMILGFSHQINSKAASQHRQREHLKVVFIYIQSDCKQATTESSSRSEFLFMVKTGDSMI